MHTIYSDGRPTPREVLEIAKAKEIGVSITDHNQIKGAIIAQDIAINENLPFICGMELGTCEGKEMLVYFSDAGGAEEFYIKEVEPYLTNRITRISRPMWEFVGERFADMKKEYQISFTTIPHPFGVLYKSVKSDVELSKEILNMVDAVEVINASMSEKANQKAYLLAKELSKFKMASTDAHLKKSIGNVTTKVKFDENGGILNTDISHNFHLDSLLTTSLSLLQITQKNFTHSILKMQ